MVLRIAHRINFNWTALSSLHERNENLFLDTALGGLGQTEFDVSGLGKLDILTLHAKQPLVKLNLTEKRVRTLVDLFTVDEKGIVKIEIPRSSFPIVNDEDLAYLFSVFPDGQNISGELINDSFVIDANPQELEKIDDPVVIGLINKLLGTTSSFVSTIQTPQFFQSMDAIREMHLRFKSKIMPPIKFEEE